MLLSQDDWYRTICTSYTSPPVVVEGMQLPSFPSDAVQINTTGQCGADTLREAFVFYQDCVNVLTELGNPLEAHHSLLDFGVGWGRIARFFLNELPIQNVHGLDVMREFIDICRETFRNDNFHVTTPFPPSEYPAERFNVVVGYSVFSHLSEDACRAWMREFARILVPGGIVAITTRGRPFFDYCQSLKGQGHEGYLESLSCMFNDFDEAKNRYDAGEFVHSNHDGVAGGGAMSADFYGETFIPQRYAETAYSDLFVLEKFLYESSRQSHPIMFFRKKR